jgi:hypothetical protein
MEKFLAVFCDVDFNVLLTIGVKASYFSGISFKVSGILRLILLQGLTQKLKNLTAFPFTALFT